MDFSNGMVTEVASNISRDEWEMLVSSSPVASWFQTWEAYQLYSSLPDLFYPFFFATIDSNNRLKGLIVGYVTKEELSVKQFFTRRAIIYGGPLLAEDILEGDLQDLLLATKEALSRKAIYVETRNFGDYSRWRSVFEKCGFEYEEHYDFHIDTTSAESARERIGKHRWKYIRLSLRDGAKMQEKPTLQQVKQFYALLSKFYKTKVRTPLYSWHFFEVLYSMPYAHFLLVEYENKIVGGTVCVGMENGVLYEWFACGHDIPSKGIRPSSVATWMSMKFAAENGFVLFDLMGAGRPQERYGIRDFKAEFGGELKELGRFKVINNKLLYAFGALGVKILKLPLVLKNILL